MSSRSTKRTEERREREPEQSHPSKHPIATATPSQLLASHSSGPGVTEARSRTGLEAYPGGFVQSLLGPQLQRAKDVATAVKEKVTGTQHDFDIKASSAGVAKLPELMKAVVFKGTGKVEVVSNIATPTLGNAELGRMEHAVILKVIATAICGSDCHMYRGTAQAPPNLVMGHEVTGEVVEVGRDVLYLKPGDWVSVPFPVACGRCVNCKCLATSVCLHTCADHPGAIYGYAGMGDWRGGQSEYFLLPYADFNGLKLPKDMIGTRILDIAQLADVFPTGYHGAFVAGVKTGDTVYIAGAGPIGIACAASCFMLGASAVVIADPKADRLANARKLGCLTIDTSKTKTSQLNDALKQLIGKAEVDRAVDCVGYECVKNNTSRPPVMQEQVLRDLMTVIRYGGGLGIPGAYFPPKLLAKKEGVDGHLDLAFGELWNKGVTIGQMGQCPAHRYNEALLQMILFDRVKLSDALNVKVVGLDEAAKAYETFNAGEPVKYVLDPHGIVRQLLGLPIDRSHTTGTESEAKATK